jgi:hypothetical protein
LRSLAAKLCVSPIRSAVIDLGKSVSLVGVALSASIARHGGQFGEIVGPQCGANLFLQYVLTRFQLTVREHIAFPSAIELNAQRF